MRRTVIPWVAAFGILALATVGGVALANATVFGAGSFVRIYLDAIARGDAESALDLPGVDATEASTALLDPDALTGLESVQQVSDVDLGDGVHRVAYAWVSPGRLGHQRVPGRTDRHAVRPVPGVGLRREPDRDDLAHGEQRLGLLRQRAAGGHRAGLG